MKASSLDGEPVLRRLPGGVEKLVAFDPPRWKFWRWAAFAWRRFALVFAPAWPFVFVRRIPAVRVEVVVGSPPRVRSVFAERPARP